MIFGAHLRILAKDFVDTFYLSRGLTDGMW